MKRALDSRVPEWPASPRVKLPCSLPPESPPHRLRIAPVTILAMAFVFLPLVAEAQPIPLPKLHFGVESAKSPQDVAVSLQILFLLTLLSLAPSFLVLMTSFTRIIVVLSFLRSALGTQQMPPNQVMIGFAMFLTFLVMAPAFKTVNREALQPYLVGKISYSVALDKGMKPLREFMLKQTRQKDLLLFVRVAKLPRPRTAEDLPSYVVIPAFAMSEFKTAFQIGFAIFIPFLIIDMVIASTLMSMGMLMLPPVMISLPFKILLFVLVDGWYLVVQSLLLSFK